MRVKPSKDGCVARSRVPERGAGEGQDCSVAALRHVSYCCVLVTVRAIVWVCVMDPEVAVTVMVELPTGVPG